MLDLRKLKMFKERIIDLKFKLVISKFKRNKLNMIFFETVHRRLY
jgi:hypothetical protein